MTTPEPDTGFLDPSSSGRLDRVASAAVGALLAHTTDMLALVGPDGRVRYMSPAVEQLLGAPADAFVGRPVLDVVHPGDLEAMSRHLARMLATGFSVGPVEAQVLRSDGEVRIAEVVGTDVSDVPGLDGTVLVRARDVTELRARDQQLEFARTHDAATGLGDEREMIAATARALAGPVPHITVLALGIDDLRELAGGAGPDAQDDVVRALIGRVADRMGDPAHRPPAAVTRVGSSTFLVLCEDEGEPLDELAMGEEARQAMSAALLLGGRTLRPSVSVGVVAVRRAGGDGRELGAEAAIDNAILGLREARRQGGGLTVVVDDAMLEDLERATSMARDLRRSVEEDGLAIHYQPKVALDTGRLLGFEALARWTHPRWGVVPPPVFIELAEQHGVIDDLGDWILHRAVHDAASWASPSGTPLGVAVNVSARQLSPHLRAQVALALSSSGLEPDRLTLEVTESTVMQDLESVTTVLGDLKDLGVRISIDDFGTGYSSLAVLRHLRLDELKIDKSFVDGLGRTAEDSAIVAAVMAMAHALDLTVVAEGIENPEQRDELRRLGAEQGQGYLFSRPVSADDARVLAAQREEEAVRAAEGGCVVVVADDSPEVLQLLTVSLAAAGFTPHPTSDGPAALDAIRRLRPVAAVLDVSMPGLRGPDVCRHVRAEPAIAHTTVVALSANASADDHIEAFLAGADEYVVKPFSPREIVSRTTAAVARRRATVTAAAEAP